MEEGNISYHENSSSGTGEMLEVSESATSTVRSKGKERKKMVSEAIAEEAPLLFSKAPIAEGVSHISTNPIKNVRLGLP